MNTFYCTLALIAAVVFVGPWAGMAALGLMITFGGYQ